ncbi:DMT family transporter [Fulvivirgaceae bacterium BMA12]|uniref:DMT family transporter n=1 Tax=Agaribacillus aureus TaxID=3051825 RepID=A0ABT8LFB7_9BACT|nr:DMT family transporter [Fulvivirgaceae bacterium BMA12]
MNQILLPLIAFFAGIFLAVQGSLNAQLGVLLKNPLLATLSAFLSSSLFALLFVFIQVRDFPSAKQIYEIPFYLWFTGGLFSVLGISMYYFTIPKLGVATMISLGLCGQLIFAVVAGHFGWFNLPEEPISWPRFIGVMAMILGIILINIK